MKKIFANIVCAFVPSRAARHNVRRRMLAGPAPAEAESGRENPAAAVAEIKNDLYNNTAMLWEIKHYAQRAEHLVRRAEHLVRADIAAAALHRDTFAGCKNKFAGRDVVLIATGPSFSKFKPVPGAIYVGVNRAFAQDKAKLDYLFIQDGEFRDTGLFEKAGEYPCEKFYGIMRPGLMPERKYTISESEAVRHNAKRFYLNVSWDPIFRAEPLDFPFDISVQPLVAATTVAVSAMQFILYGNPRRIYLVGCDCSTAGHFDKKSQTQEVRDNNDYSDHLSDEWRKIKEFADAFYPETEIISVNPVGLKGLFKDEYSA